MFQSISNLVFTEKFFASFFIERKIYFQSDIYVCHFILSHPYLSKTSLSEVLYESISIIYNKTN